MLNKSDDAKKNSDGLLDVLISYRQTLKLQSDVFVKLFQNYSCSYDGSVLWKHEDRYFKDICTK